MSLPNYVVGLCHEYARLECCARQQFAEMAQPNKGCFDLAARYADIYRGGARFLYDLAPPEALHWLDTIKKVFEIDMNTMDVNTILMRASVIDADTTPTPRPRFTCQRCGMISYNPNDLRQGYCGNCHDFTAREIEP